MGFKLTIQHSWQQQSCGCFLLHHLGSCVKPRPATWLPRLPQILRTAATCSCKCTMIYLQCARLTCHMVVVAE
eukprot:1160920-Pelagomonas_calceolata.AAC.4